MQDTTEHKNSQNTSNKRKKLNEIIIDEDENKIFVGANYIITGKLKDNDNRRKIN